MRTGRVAWLAPVPPTGPPGRLATKVVHHAVAGVLELTSEALHLPGDPGIMIIIYTLVPASPTEQALAFFDNWSTWDEPEHLTGPDSRKTAR